MKTKRFVSILVTLPALAMFAIVLSVTSAIARDMHQSQNPAKITVQYRLAKGNILAGNNVKVDVRNKDIVLTGTVRTIYEKSKAGKLAQSAGGHYMVTNDLIVTPPPTSDSLIEAEVMHRIHRNTTYTVFDWATAHSRKGIVTLRGWVNSPWDVVLYKRQAEHVVGVKRVVDDLKVAIGYEDLAHRAVRIVYRQGMLFGYSLKLDPPIHVIAVDGSVILEGKIYSSQFGSYLASLVRFRTGAIHVVNDLQSPA